MTKTLTELISATQAQLIDDGTRFSTATCTAAIRAALSKLNHRIPLQAADNIDAVSDQYEYEAQSALFVTDVLLFDQSGQEDTALEYDAYNEDNRAWLRLRQPQSTGEILLVRYAQAHTINGLDSATDSTLTADQDQIVTDGACAEALAMRAASRIETINLQQNVSDNYREAMGAFRAAFEAGIQYYEKRLNPPPSPMRHDAWNIPGWSL